MAQRIPTRLFKSLAVAALTLEAMLPASAQLFTNINAGLRGVFYSSSVAGDFDGDGKMDLLVAGIDKVGDAVATVWHNSGSGSFSDFAELGGSALGQVGVGDFFNTGRIDALVTGQIGPSTQLWHNLDNGNFLLITNSGLPGIGSSFIAAGDFDNDGKLDVMLWGGVIQISRNLGNGMFTNMNAGLRSIGSGASVSGVFAADFDGDGYLDVLIGKVLWRNLGNGTFTNIVSGLPASATAIGDFDNDGYLDVLVGAQVWRNLGNGTFTNFGTAISGTGLAVGDYDNDGYLDYLRRQGAISILLHRFGATWGMVPSRAYPLCQGETWEPR